MAQQIQVEILDQERVLINGAELTDRQEIFDLLRSLTKQTPNSSVMLIPRAEKFYQATSKVVYGALMAGIEPQNLLYKTEDGSVVPIMELEPSVFE